jgi:ATP-dependent 26S proteasome regulatory subunit
VGDSNDGDSVIAALLAAVAADPSNLAVRRHLAELCLAAGRYQDAWGQATVGLEQSPADVGLLRVAAASGPHCGEPDRAAAYKTLLDALDPGDPVSRPATSTEQPATPTEQSTMPPNPVSRTGLPEAATPAPETGPEAARQPLGSADTVPDSVDELVDLWNDDESSAPAPEIGDFSRSEVRLSDVGGMDEVKKRLQSSFLNPMRNPEMQQAFGKSLRGGLLLWGPPGCGKTFLAKAVAGELEANFYSVGLSDVLDMWMGSSERNVTAIFDVARANSPCVLFLDEIDALGQKRTNLRGGGGAMRGVVNQLLQEMDGATKANDGVFVLAATNHPWDIDAALLRPGRLDRSLLVLPPDQAAREAIFSYHLRGKPTEKLRFDKAAKATDGLTGADIALVCEQATETAMEASIADDRIYPITMADLQQAIKDVSPSYGQWADTARNYAMFNNEGGVYDELLRWLKKYHR